jgi:hypothetical protein
MAQFNSRYSRPRTLSDPHRDYEFQLATDALLLPDAKLHWHHFQSLLGPYKAAGTYEEVVYFLPLALDHLIEHEAHALDLVTTPIWFASEYDEQLRHDKLRNAVRDRIRDGFSNWTREFNVIHFDEAACQAKGWGLPHCDVVKFSEIICEGTQDLVRFKKHADIALELFQSFANHGGDDVKAAWLLELASAQTAVYSPPDDHHIRDLLNDRKLLVSAAEVVRSNRIGRDPSPTYWDDTFAKLDL